MIFDQIVWRGKLHWSLRSNPTWRARQARLYLQGWQIYIGVLILLLKDSTRCEFSCLTGHLYMDVQLLGQTQRSIVEWIVHKTKILNNYKAKVRKVKGCHPIKLDIKSEIFTGHEEFNWFFILLVSRGEKVQTRYSLTQEERGLSRWERVPFQPLFDLKSNRKSNSRLGRTHAKILSTSQQSIDKD